MDSIIVAAGAALVFAALSTVINLIKTLFEYAAVSQNKKYKVETSSLGKTSDGNTTNVVFKVEYDGEIREGTFIYPVDDKTYNAWKEQHTELELYVWEEDFKLKGVPTNIYSMNTKVSLIFIGIFVLLFLLGSIFLD